MALLRPSSRSHRKILWRFLLRFLWHFCSVHVLYQLAYAVFHNGSRIQDEVAFSVTVHFLTSQVP